MFKRIASVFNVLTRRRRFEDSMADELRFHIEQYAAELVQSGLTPEEAARRARMEFGSVDNVKDDCREARGVRLFDELYRELRYAFRLLRKDAGFTATALLTPRSLHWRQSHYIRRRRFGSAAAAPVSRCGPACDRVQHLPKGRRRTGWVLTD